MDKPHEYEHIEWINSNQSRIQLSFITGINESLKIEKQKSISYPILLNGVQIVIMKQLP
ncbi:MAG: hypothetical protein CM1200mP33_5100 [Chloroflexota bacterium]|nr:MAG: hypothetical protein CM1200mP33_5100 [Chloroflexota bacterium]